MMKKWTVGLIACIGLGILTGYCKEISPGLTEHISFYLSFDKSLQPDLARGSDKVASQPAEETYSYIPGVEKQAVLGGAKVRGLHYNIKDNLDFSRPGAVSFWFNPVDWDVQKPDTPTQGKTKWKKNLTAGFFATAYSPDGYVVLQRNTSHVPGDKKDILMLLFPCMKNFNKAGRRFSVEIAMKSWHHLAMIWNGVNYRVFLDQKEIMSTVIPMKIDTGKLSRTFQIYMARGLAFDEFYIFDKELTAMEVQQLGSR